LQGGERAEVGVVRQQQLRLVGVLLKVVVESRIAEVAVGSAMRARTIWACVRKGAATGIRISVDEAVPAVEGVDVGGERREGRREVWLSSGCGGDSTTFCTRSSWV
jgi:hypothetical protein